MSYKPTEKEAEIQKLLQEHSQLINKDFNSLTEEQKKRFEELNVLLNDVYR